MHEMATTITVYFLWKSAAYATDSAADSGRVLGHLEFSKDIMNVVNTLIFLRMLCDEI